MLELEEALKQILAAIPSPETEGVSLSEASGRFLGARVCAAVDLPVFDNSAMDGFAVRGSDLASASPDHPVRLRMIGRVPAGQSFSGGPIPSGSCVRLFTGSPLPQGADAVVMQEDTKPLAENTGDILVLESVKVGENVRRQGEDVQKGSILGEAGDCLSVVRLALFSAAGVSRIEVARRPRVGVIVTGSELREPGEPLAPGQIYESNRLMLANLVQGTGAMVRTFQIVEDAPPATRHALEQAFSECDVVVSSGGVSVGEMDFLKLAFAEAGGDLQFWKVAIRPGRPFAFGRRKGKLLFGLPGNPVSGLVTFLMLVRPALLRWQGAADLNLPTFPGVLAEPLINHGNRRHFVRVRVDSAGNVFSAGPQASHMLGSMAFANGLVDMPAETTLADGAKVPVIRWGS